MPDPDDLSFSEWCAAELERLLDAEQLALLARARELRRLAAADPERHPEGQPCAVCGAWYVPAPQAGDGALYCSKRCGNRAAERRALAAA